jgi:hypothetical protein
MYSKAKKPLGLNVDLKSNKIAKVNIKYYNRQTNEEVAPEDIEFCFNQEHVWWSEMKKSKSTRRSCKKLKLWNNLALSW